MTMKIQRLVNVAMVLLTWSTLPFLGLRNIKKFLPATLLIVLFEGINGIIGKDVNGGFFIINQNHTYLGNSHFILVRFL